MVSPKKGFKGVTEGAMTDVMKEARNRRKVSLFSCPIGMAFQVLTNGFSQVINPNGVIEACVFSAWESH